MDHDNFISELITKISNIRSDEFNKFNFQIIENTKQKTSFEDGMEFKSFKSKIIKKASIDKLKPGNIGKKEYETSNSDSNIDILADDIFDKTDDSLPPVNDLSIDTVEVFDLEKKKYMIDDFLQRKNIILEEDNLKKIDDIINNPDINLKKYITISKMYKQITKISFLKKLENGSYVIDINDDKPKKNKKYFLK
jgi:hypothetical protein